MNVVKMDYPSNSNKAKSLQPAKPERPPVEKVVKGKVIQKKKKLSKRLLEAFGVPESKGVAAYIFQDVMVPAVKEMIYAMIVGGASMSLFNEVRDRSRFGGRSGYRDYNGYSRITKVSSPGQRNDRQTYQAATAFDEIVLEQKADAEEVLERLVDLVDTYGQATVADLYDAVGVTKDYTSTRWGWRNLASARIIAVRDGWMIDLPKEEEL